MEFFDSHSHYNDEKFDLDRKEIIEETYKQGVTKFICAGYDVESSKFAIEIAKKYEYIFTICGISPNDVPEKLEQIDEMVKQIEQLVIQNRNKVKAIGEIGLDYYWNKENKQIQKSMFIKQIELANKLEMPIAIHSRDAQMDTIQTLKENPVIKKGIFHCCQLNRELVKEALKLDFYISFAGPITFKNSKNAEEIVKMVPLDKILIETDSPYLAPEPVRGSRNTSINVKYVAERIASIKGISLERVATATYENAEKIYEMKI